MEIDDVKRVHPQLSQTVVEELIDPAAAVRVVNTDLGEADLEELSDIDGDGRQEGGEDVGEDPGVGVGHLELPVVVRPADGQVPLYSHGYDEVDTQAENYPDISRM